MMDLPPRRGRSPGNDRCGSEAGCYISANVRWRALGGGRGRQRPALVKTANWLNHLEFDWQSPVWSPLFERLVGQHRLIRYDERGTGLSDRDVPDSRSRRSCAIWRPSWMRWGSALRAAGYLAGRPRVDCLCRPPSGTRSRLVLCGGFAKGWRKRGSATDVARAEASITLIREGWGQDNPAARQMFTSLIVPDATLEEMRWFNDLERISATSETAIRLLHVIGDIDVSDLLPQVTVPTLVLHSRGDARVPSSMACCWHGAFPTRVSSPSKARTISFCRTSRRGRVS